VASRHADPPCSERTRIIVLKVRALRGLDCYALYFVFWRLAVIPLVRLHHVSFAIRDLAASQRFFGDVLGLKELERPSFNFSGVWYALGDRQLHLIVQDSAGSDAADRISRSDHMALEVSDLNAVKKVLDGAGIEFGEGSNQALGMDQIFCRDPDGHVIEFVRYR
jgi:catechol 2,3-dioxygenase-like lactoylglutathione lyase family enzyme